MPVTSPEGRCPSVNWKVKPAEKAGRLISNEHGMCKFRYCV